MQRKLGMIEFPRSAEVLLIHVSRSAEFRSFSGISAYRRIVPCCLMDIIIDLVNIDILIPILILLIHHLHHHPDHLLQVHRVQKQDQQNMSESTDTERGTKPKIKISHQQTRICLAMITSKERNIHQDLHKIRQLLIMSHTQISLLLLQIRKRAEPLSVSMQICPKIYLMEGKYQRTRVSRLQSASLKLMVEQYPPFGRKV